MRRVQVFWKRAMLVNEARKVLLAKLWDAECKKMIATGQKKSKKHKLMAMKIEEMDEKRRDKALGDHFYMSVIKFITAFKRWVRSGRVKRHPNEVVPLHMTPVVKSNKPKLEKTGSAFFAQSKKTPTNPSTASTFSKVLNQNLRWQTTGRPVFEFKPSEALLRKLILDAADDKSTI